MLYKHLLMDYKLNNNMRHAKLAVTIIYCGLFVLEYDLIQILDYFFGGSKD